jgi:glutamyl/glutaminyl-tRNA synthetase
MSVGSASTGGDNQFHASDYFQQLYAWAEHLIEANGDAYVDSTSRPTRLRATRGTLTESGRNSPWRDRSRGREPGPVPRACVPANSPTARGSCARKH